MKKNRDKNLPVRINDILMQVFNQVASNRRVLHNWTKDLSLTMLEAEVCLLIERHEGVTGSEIADALDVTRSATSQFISKLKEKDLVKVEADAENARLKRVYLTSRGKEASAAARRYLEMMAEALYDVPDETLLHYLDFVTKLRQFHASAVGQLKGTPTE
jgi:DNA-binding MarR family transcriptional regulator